MEAKTFATNHLDINLRKPRGSSVNKGFTDHKNDVSLVVKSG